MKKVCLRCYQIYDNVELKTAKYADSSGQFSTWNFCPKSNCFGNVIEVDDNMVYIIIKLNKNNYETQACCQGHVSEHSIFIYIKFKDNHLSDIIKKIGIPYGFKIEENIIGFSLNPKEDQIDNQIIINEKNTELCKWVKKI